METSEDEEAQAAAEVRRRRVYLTTDLGYAEFFAWSWGTPQGVVPGRGEVYQVQPLNRLEPDPDDPAGTSMATRRCRILRRRGVVPPRSLLSVNVLLAEHATFDDGTPQFTRNGWQLCDREWLARDPGLREKVDQENRQLFNGENMWRASQGLPPLDDLRAPLVDELMAGLDRERRRSADPSPDAPLPLND